MSDNTPWINMGEPYWAFDHAKVEDLHNARYVGDFCLRTKNGGWSEVPAAVFWQETPPQPGYSNYFALYRDDYEGRLLITSGASVAEGVWDAVIAASGEIVFSRWRHDCRTSADGTAMADGGRDYFRGYGRRVTLRLDDGRMVVVDEVAEEEPASAGR